MEIKIEIYSKRGCHLCDKAKAVIEKVKDKYPITISEIDISNNPALLKKYKEKIPVVFINNRQAFVYKVHEVTLTKKLELFLNQNPPKSLQSFSDLDNKLLLKG